MATYEMVNVAASYLVGKQYLRILYKKCHGQNFMFVMQAVNYCICMRDGIHSTGSQQIFPHFRTNI